MAEDLDDDCQVTVIDIMQVASRWGEGSGSPGDLNGDGVVDVGDVQQVAGQWRETCHVLAGTTRYYALGGRRIAMRKAGTLYYLFTDHLGSTSVTYDTTNGQTQTLRYFPWGGMRAGDVPTDRRFTGQRWDGTIGLYDYNARWYDPMLGRFIQPDTFVPSPGDPQQLNRFTYAGNNPLRYRDSTGHWLETVWDVANILWDIHEVRRDPSLVNIGALVVDVGATVLPFVPAGVGMVARGGKAAKAAAHADEFADAAKALSHADEAVDAARALERVRETGRWVQRAESISPRSRAYQEFVTGITDYRVFELKGVTFDAFENGVLMDAKGFYKQFVDPASGQFRGWFSGRQELLDQARRQIEAAGGVPIEWHFNEIESLEAVRKLFEEEGIQGIRLVHDPMP